MSILVLSKTAFNNVLKIEFQSLEQSGVKQLFRLIYRNIS